MAKSVLLCTGGSGKVFPFTTNANICTGDGMALAYHAGAPLKDMEFVQYHPTGLPGTGILMTEASRGEGGYLVNKEGQRFLEEYIPSKMELGPRDILSRAIMQEIEKGRAFDGPYGEYVHLDIRHLGEKKIDEKLPFVRELTTKFVGIDPVHEPIPVRPVVHYMMGGVDTDIEGRTPLPGLYSAGEAACVSINGANRLGSNSLTELLVFGARAGKAAAAFAAERRSPSPSLLAQAQGAASASLAQCQVSLDGTTLDVQQITVPGGSGTGRTLTLVGSGTSSSSPGGGNVLVQCSDSGGTFSAINVTATQVDHLH